MKETYAVWLCDGSVVAALCTDRLIESALRLGMKLAITELVYERELTGLISEDELTGLNGVCGRIALRVEALEPAVLERALALHRVFPHLALTDASTLALAAHRSWLVLTQNPMVERVAKRIAVSCQGLEWLHEEAARRQPAPDAAAIRCSPRIREEHGTFTCFA